MKQKPRNVENIIKFNYDRLHEMRVNRASLIVWVV